MNSLVATSLLVKKNMSQLSLLCAILLTATIVSLCANSGTAFAADANLPIEGLPINHAVILVGGIHETSHYFDSWVAALASPNTVVMGWNHDHRAMSMRASARLLAGRISDLSAQGITDVTIVAHSMGGLVAKGAIDELSRTGKAKNFVRIEIRAFGTPWGGYTLADLVPVLPWSETISRAIGYPMGPDIGPHSDYMTSLAQPMPANGKLHIYVGTADHIARPEAFRTKARYKSIEARAVTIKDIEGFNHVAYNSAPADFLNMPRTLAAPDSKVLSSAVQSPAPWSIDITTLTNVVHLERQRELGNLPEIGKAASIK